MKITVFYAWQSDNSIPASLNRNFIEDALKKAVKKIRRDDAISIDPVIDRDTKGVSGTPHIPATILEKIDSCSAFVGDVSIINPKSSFRQCPNPNVLFELGYAVSRLGWNRTILVMNEAFGKIQELPFDLEKRRIANYKLGKSLEDKAGQKEKLINQIELSLRRIIDDIEAEESNRLTVIVQPEKVEKVRVGDKIAEEDKYLKKRKRWLVSKEGVDEVRANALELAPKLRSLLEFEFKDDDGLQVTFEDGSRNGFLDVLVRFEQKVIWKVKWWQAYSNAVEQCGLETFEIVNFGPKSTNAQSHFVADLMRDGQIMWKKKSKSEGLLSLDDLAEKFVDGFISDIRRFHRSEHENGSGLQL